ncbi:DUF397 domain-containing protein [Saccharothrix sp. HUAS TT1]|uniref:DUF397 domain-containing protein n=1 Tax=unclassified Saccharothrix TaxID=2593673 RepID=UPI00345BE47B
MQHDDELSWRKSRRSTSNANCVEVAFASDDEARVRDTKRRDGGTLGFTPRAWQAFLEAQRTE